MSSNQIRFLHKCNKFQSISHNAFTYAHRTQLNRTADEPNS